MMPFPSLNDLRPFVGATLFQIRFDPNSLQFVFDDGLVLVSENAIEHIQPDGEILHYGNESFRDGPTLLHRLIGKVLTKMDREDLSLTLTFSDGGILRLFSELGSYESGHFELADGSVLVF